MDVLLYGGASELAVHWKCPCGEPENPEGINNFMLFLKKFHCIKNAGATWLLVLQTRLFLKVQNSERCF